MKKQPEIWKYITGWEGKYMISNHGRLKSIGGKYKKSKPDGYITFGCVDMSGYHVVVLRRPNFQERFRIHTLVGTYFVNKPESEIKLCINHKDGIKRNNYFENLEWITLKENCAHAIKIGLHDIKGEKHHNAKLTKEKVIKMRFMRKTLGLTHKKLGELFGIDRRQVGDVLRGVNWGWLQEGL